MTTASPPFLFRDCSSRNHNAGMRHTVSIDSTCGWRGLCRSRIPTVPWNVAGAPPLLDKTEDIARILVSEPKARTGPILTSQPPCGNNRWLSNIISLIPSTKVRPTGESLKVCSLPSSTPFSPALPFATSPQAKELANVRDRVRRRHPSNAPSMNTIHKLNAKDQSR